MGKPTFHVHSDETISEYDYDAKANTPYEKIFVLLLHVAQIITWQLCSPNGDV